MTATGRMIENRLNQLDGDRLPVILEADFNFNGTVGLGTVNVTTANITGALVSSAGISATGLVEYANDAAALSGGLVTGDLYKTAGAVKIVL